MNRGDFVRWNHLASARWWGVDIRTRYVVHVVYWDFGSDEWYVSVRCHKTGKSLEAPADFFTHVRGDRR